MGSCLERRQRAWRIQPGGKLVHLGAAVGVGFSTKR